MGRGGGVGGVGGWGGGGGVKKIILYSDSGFGLWTVGSMAAG